MIATTWRKARFSSEDTSDDLTNDEQVEKREHIALVEGFGYACYPTALKKKTGNRKQDDAHEDRVEARLWADRVAGRHLAKPSNAQPPLYNEPWGDA